MALTDSSKTLDAVVTEHTVAKLRVRGVVLG